MKKFIVPLMLVSMAGFVPGTGCQHCQKPCPPAPPPLARGSAFMVPPVDRSIPAGPVFAPQTGFQTPAAPPPGSAIPTDPPPLSVPAQPSWGPPSSSGARLLAPEFGTQEPPLNTEKPKVAES